MKYLYLTLAILLEVTGSSFLKASEGFTKWIPTVSMIVAFIGCFYFLSLALKSIPMGMAYAIWAGVGIVLLALISVFVFKQNLDLPAIIGIGFIIVGVLIIHLFSKSMV